MRETRHAPALPSRHAADRQFRPGRCVRLQGRAGQPQPVNRENRLKPSTAFFDATARAGVNIHQFYSLDIRALPDAALADVYAFDGARGIGEPTKYTIQFTHPRHDLSRSELLNRIAAFVIQPPPRDRWSQPEPAHRVQGVITGFALLASNRDESIYEIVLESRLALLRNAPKCRFFLDMTIPEIIEQILREHDFNQVFAGFEFRLHRTYRKRGFVMQWGEDDLAFTTRLCRRSGIWFVCETGEHCERVRFGDDYTHYRRDPGLAVAYRSLSGLETSGVESVQTLEMRATTLPTNYTVRTFSKENRTSKPIDAASPIHEDRTTYGETYTWGTPDLSEAEAKEEAQLRREVALAEQVQYHGTCNMLDLTPGSVLKLSNRDLPDAKYGLLAVRVTCSASRKKGYTVEFDAIPSDRLYRLPLLEHTWPKIQGVITGTIASPGGYKDPYLDLQGCYIVHLHTDKDARKPGLESCPMRLAKPFAGAGQTGFHFGLVEGTVVTVGFLWGNPDLPFISQVLHTAQDTDPIIAGAPWGTRNTLRTRSNNTLEMDDRNGKERIKLATEHGKTQLNLGHTVDRNHKDRGKGFELRTDNQGNVRAGGGLHLTAYAQPNAQGEQSDTQPATGQFNLSQAQIQELVEAARTAKAEIADLKAENQWLKEKFNGLNESVMALSAPAGIGVATPERLMVSTGKDMSVASSAGFNVNVLRTIALAAKGAISLFAHSLDLKLPGRGKVLIQALAGEVSIASKGDTLIRSTEGRVVIDAEKEILLRCGGSYYRITNCNITHATQGDYIEKAVSWSKDAPDGTITKAALPWVNDIGDLQQHGSKFSG
ncbi:type VI secretion system Vgr family protein [Paraburkholderia sp. GAS42]|uniref:type VI secretion system Vgr family protein n=1 Tax=Paraburkholderia sp. GAS42 TaxID=3035135 RepID=UPI003D1F0D67